MNNEHEYDYNLQQKYMKLSKTKKFKNTMIFHKAQI